MLKRLFIPKRSSPDPLPPVMEFKIQCPKLEQTVLDETAINLAVREITADGNFQNLLPYITRHDLQWKGFVPKVVPRISGDLPSNLAVQLGDYTDRLNEAYERHKMQPLLYRS